MGSVSSLERGGRIPGNAAGASVLQNISSDEFEIDHLGPIHSFGIGTSSIFLVTILSFVGNTFTSSVVPCRLVQWLRFYAGSRRKFDIRIDRCSFFVSSKMLLEF